MPFSLPLLSIVNTLSYLSLPKASRWTLLYQSKTSVSSTHFRNDHHVGSAGAIRHAIGHLCYNITYKMATCAGAEDRWVVGVGQPVCATADPFRHCSSRFGLDRVATEGSVWLCSGDRLRWCQGLYRHITEAPPHQHPSGGK